MHEIVGHTTSEVGVMWAVKAFRIRASDLPSSDVEFTMQLTYRTPMPGFKFRESNAEPILNYDGDLFDELAWDEDCAWAEWHSVEDPVKGTISRQSLFIMINYCVRDYLECKPADILLSRI